MLYENCTHVLEQYANTVTKSLGPLPASIPLGSTYFALLEGKSRQSWVSAVVWITVKPPCPLSFVFVWLLW